MVIKVACHHVTNLQLQSNGNQHVEENVNFLNSKARIGTKGTLIYNELVDCGDTGAVNHSLPQGLCVRVPLSSVGAEGFYECRGWGVEIEEETRQWVVRNTCLLIEQRSKVALPFRNYDNRCVRLRKAKARLQWEERGDAGGFLSEPNSVLKETVPHDNSPWTQELPNSSACQQLLVDYMMR